MQRIKLILMCLLLVFAPLFSAVLTPVDVEAKSAAPCKAGYFRNQATNRCKKIVTVSETTSTITTTTYNTKTGIPTIKKTCKAGYWWNASTGRCNKKKTCGIGYYWVSSNNSCKKIVCSFGFKVQDASNLCKPIICEKGHILNQKTGNCVINRNGKFKECEDGWTLDLMTLECALIGTKGSNDPASKNAKNVKKSQNLAVHYEAKSTKSLASIIIQSPDNVQDDIPKDNTSDENANSDQEESQDDNANKKDCGEGKFLNPKTNRCKNLQEITETSTGKTITTYDPSTGEPTTVKICNEGYYLNTETNRCNKVKEEKASNKTTTSSATTSSTKTCPEGKVLNPKTNRCKNEVTVVESSTGKTITTFDPETGEEKTEKICNEGYELNEETNRCNKKKVNNGEDYELEVPELGSKKEDSFIGLGSIIAVIAIGIGLVIFQFRKEIVKFFRGLKAHKE